MFAISMHDVSFAYESGIEMHFNFAVEKGQRLAIMGASGSGKSTLLHLLAGFEAPLSGAICFDGVNVNSQEASARPVSMLFQDNNLFGHLTTSQNVGLALAPRLRLSKDQQDAIDAALMKVGLAGMGKRLPAELSGGERQRAALARSLLRNKPILLLDEPFAALGPAMRGEMIDIVLALQAEKQLTVLMVTHNPDDAGRFATHIGFTESGALTTILPVSALMAPKQDSALARYLGFHQH